MASSSEIFILTCFETSKISSSTDAPLLVRVDFRFLGKKIGGANRPGVRSLSSLPSFSSPVGASSTSSSESDFKEVREEEEESFPELKGNSVQISRRQIYLEC